jgi:hypothetical protein
MSNEELQRWGSAFIQRAKILRSMINFLLRLPLRSIVLIPLRAPTKVGEHSGLVLSYGVKQAAKRQAKQCTALFCATPTH